MEKKQKQTKKGIDKNFFNEMNYELAGDIGAIDNEEMMNNEKLITGKNRVNGSVFKIKKK
ncbi:hypothetical protein SAMN05446037_1009112 [Anaerovirgula multivorans]|uniref:Uncharacterized protein n=1 Tax=Anaerovirgula multivorans TaxID=312168 RepID=A0A239E9N4_9FIRM|nr:hypothetical protein [Anaerovirgula multivorans]SNS40632.1 hypothetical protein SAMN05446037_1009112 [Anaerovirgula multivorans]